MRFLGLIGLEQCRSFGCACRELSSRQGQPTPSSVDPGEDAIRRPAIALKRIPINKSIGVQSNMRQIFLLNLLSVVPLLGLSFTTQTTKRRHGVLTQRYNTQNEDEGDFMTKLFKRFLPDPEDMGMKRMTVESAPEQYYCTKERWADPVEDDDDIVKLFRPALAQTRMETRSMEICFDAARDGWNADVFHEKVDKQGACVVFCRTESGGCFGGYNPKGWVSYGEFRGSLAAFLFCFPDGKTDALPLKLSKVGGAGLAQVDDGSGPKFGMTE